MFRLRTITFDIIKRFFIGTFRGIRWFFIQMLVWTFTTIPFSILGIRGYGERSGAILAFSLFICIFTYSMIFNWYYAFVSLRRFLNTFWIPYIVYACAVFLGILAELDWDIRAVSIDQHMLLGWFMPLYGIGLLHLKRKLRKILIRNKKRWKFIIISLKVASWLFSLFLLMCILISITAFLIYENIIDREYAGEIILKLNERIKH